MKKVKLSQIGKIITGRTPASRLKNCFGTEYPFITPRDMKEQKWCIKTERYLSNVGIKILKNSLIPKNSVAVSCIGSQMGKAIMIKNTSVTNQQINSIIPNKQIIPDYLYYILTLKKNEFMSKGSTLGAAIPILNKSHFSNFEIKIHQDLNLQKKISTILSNYDNLKDNNLERIKILHGIVRDIYRNWFTKFNFPIKKNISLISSKLGKIPKNWKIKKISEIVDISWGDTNVTKASYVSEGYPAYSASGLDGMLPYYDYERDAIVLSAIGANCGITWFASGKWSCIKNTIRFFSKTKEISNEYLYYYSCYKSFWPRRGAAQPFISQKDIEKIPIIIPPKKLLDEFTIAAKSYLKLIKNLKNQNNLLIKSRDLLLLKLITTSEIDISKIEIENIT